MFRQYITPRQPQGKRITIRDFDNLRLLLKCICLRRNKRVLPIYHSTDNWTSIKHLIKFNDLERSQYSQLAVACREAILTAVNEHASKAAHRTILEQLLRLRMFCNNGQNSLKRMTAITDGDQGDLLSILQQSEDAICVYCNCDITSLGHAGDADSAIVTVCQHLVCHECKGRYKADIIKTQKRHYKCSRCQGDFETDGPIPRTIPEEEVLNAELNISQYPSKLVKLLQDVKEHRLQGKR